MSYVHICLAAIGTLKLMGLALSEMLVKAAIRILLSKQMPWSYR